MLFDVTATFNQPVGSPTFEVARFISADTPEQAALLYLGELTMEQRATLIDLSAVSSMRITTCNGGFAYFCLNTERYLSEDERTTRPSWFKDFETGEVLVDGEEAA